MTRMSTNESFFFFNDTATTEIYPLSLHDALPIYVVDDDRERAPHRRLAERARGREPLAEPGDRLVLRHHPPGARSLHVGQDRKSTRLNSSHSQISYAVFCLKKKKHNKTDTTTTAA